MVMELEITEKIYIMKEQKGIEALMANPDSNNRKRN